MSWSMKLAALLAVAALLQACGGGGNGAAAGSPPPTSAPPPPDDPCSIAAQNRQVYEIMQEWYLWYDALPEADPASFSSPEALLEFLRFRPLDRFSRIVDRAEEEALFTAGQFVGLGFRSRTFGATQIIVDVFEGSPAERTGLVRGSRVLSVDGRPIADVLQEPAGFDGALGPDEVGHGVTLGFVNPGAEPSEAMLFKEIVTIPLVTAARAFEVDGQPTGFLVLRNFFDPGMPALEQVFQDFAAAGVRQLIVDLRYNPGGLVRVLEHFANLLGSRRAPGQAFASYLFNDKNSARDFTFLFASTPPESALSLDKLVFITTSSTGSASESLINGMRPWLPIAIVGSTTVGKPVGQLGFPICESMFRPVSFSVVNSLGAGDFFEGIAPDCPAADGLDAPFGQAGEPSFDAAVHWLQHGSCPPLAAAALHDAQRSPAQQPPAWRLDDAH
jgi:carboxyl-terminal processing protease